MDGGDGGDTLSYAHSSAAVRIDLLTGSASSGHAAGDIFRNFEHVDGSRFSDRLDGSDAANTLDGGDGSDTLNGRGGRDTLLGRDGFDTLDGGAQDDTLDGGYGNDILTGGSGNDTFLFQMSGDMNPGHDTITDFQAGDRLYFYLDTPELGIENLNFQHSGEHDVLITFAHNEGSILLLGGADMVLHVNDFDFH